MSSCLVLATNTTLLFTLLLRITSRFANCLFFAFQLVHPPSAFQEDYKNRYNYFIFKFSFVRIFSFSKLVLNRVSFFFVATVNLCRIIFYNFRLLHLNGTIITSLHYTDFYSKFKQTLLLS